ncbi:unnamed protein product [Arabidopsis thaliana]|uniref:(thale cress) hypothetical protein n=1 Tax=Arabidopsis thaliana TaxID=3702 RepID=A0A7G2F968_ARATH|nr:unnamed protein product [Arabidopsis thaliana]
MSSSTIEAPPIQTMNTEEDIKAKTEEVVNAPCCPNCDCTGSEEGSSTKDDCTVTYLKALCGIND